MVIKVFLATSSGSTAVRISAVTHLLSQLIKYWRHSFPNAACCVLSLSVWRLPVSGMFSCWGWSGVCMGFSEKVGAYPQPTGCSAPGRVLVSHNTWYICILSPNTTTQVSPLFFGNCSRMAPPVTGQENNLALSKNPISFKSYQKCCVWKDLQFLGSFISKTLRLWWLVYIHETHAQLPGSSTLSSDICAFLPPCRSKRNSRMWLASSRPWRWTTRSWTLPAMRRTACGWGRTFPQKWSPATASHCPPRSSTTTATVE